MSLHPQATYPVPEDTRRVARAAFSHGNVYIQVADHLGNIYNDAQFTALFPTRGQPAEAPARLALATLLQFAEGLPDRQAADAVRSRIDWKYVLGLDLTDPGFDHTVLSEFRTRLVIGEAEHLLLDTLLTLARTQGLLQAIDAASEQPWLQEIPAVQILRRVWAEQYVEVNGTLSWRESKDMPSPATLIASPYDPEARYSTKREVEWVGYKVHLTETCDPATPHLIVNVETTPATTPDDQMIATVHASLEPRGLLPAEHLVDKGYTDSQVLVDSQRTYGVTLIGPVADDPSWQARAGLGFDKAQFLVDWDQQVVTCPMGKQSISWLPNTYPQNGMTWEARFARKDCTPCPHRTHCTRPKKEPRIIPTATLDCVAQIFPCRIAVLQLQATRESDL